MKTAYEKWLIKCAEDGVKDCPEMGSKVNIIAQFLFMDCSEGNPQAFDLVEKAVSDEDRDRRRGYTQQTFVEAARKILETELPANCS